MAIDTWNKRRSMMARMMPSNTNIVPVPDGSIDAPDRHQRLYRYAKAVWADVIALSKGIVFKYAELKEGLTLTFRVE